MDMSEPAKRRAIWPQATHYAGIIDRIDPGHWESKIDKAPAPDDEPEPDEGDERRQ